MEVWACVSMCVGCWVDFKGIVVILMREGEGAGEGEGSW